MIVNPDIERYISGLLPPRDEVLSDMERQAAEHHIPIVGPAVGRLLALLVRASGARRIFELGSAIGYSTLWLAHAAGAGAEVHYTDSNPRNGEQARRYFERAGVAGRVRIHVGDALAALAATAGEFDLIFNDVDKEGYPAVLERAPGRLRRGGLFITDNVLWHGAVLEPKDDSAKAVVDFNQKLFGSAELFSALVPLRDGLAVALRL